MEKRNVYVNFYYTKVAMTYEKSGSEKEYLTLYFMYSEQQEKFIKVLIAPDQKDKVPFEPTYLSERLLDIMNGEKKEASFEVMRKVEVSATQYFTVSKMFDGKDNEVKRVLTEYLDVNSKPSGKYRNSSLFRKRIRKLFNIEI